jgi:hypothetical protein
MCTPYQNGGPLPVSLYVSSHAAERLKTKLLERQKLVDIIAGPDAYRDLPRLLMDSQDGQAQVGRRLSGLDRATYAKTTHTCGSVIFPYLRSM